MVSLFSFLSSFPSIHSTSDSRIIEVERTNSVSMNVKESIILSTSYWMRTSANLYDSLPPDMQNPPERELAIKTGILTGWNLLSAHQFSDDFEVKLWCGYIDMNTKSRLSAQMITNGRVENCPGCTDLNMPECAAFIQLSQKTAPDGNDSVSLKGPFLPSTPFSFGAVGASIYSPKYKTADVVYVPLDTVIE